LWKTTSIKTLPKLDLDNIPQIFWNNLQNHFSVLDMDEKEPEELWADIKTMIIEETEKRLIRKKKKPTKPWMSEATLKVIEEE